MSRKLEIVYIYHDKCQASLNLLLELNEIKDKFSAIEYIDLDKDQIETSIDITAVPTLIVDNEKVYTGKQAFDFIREKSKKEVAIKQEQTSSKKKNIYSSLYLAPPDEENNNKNRVTFD